MPTSYGAHMRVEDQVYKIVLTLLLAAAGMYLLTGRIVEGEITDPLGWVGVGMIIAAACSAMANLVAAIAAQVGQRRRTGGSTT